MNSGGAAGFPSATTTTSAMNNNNNSKMMMMMMRPKANGFHHQHQSSSDKHYTFQMPLHYPRYKKSDYETMPEWQLDRLLAEYGLPVTGDATHKRKFAMGAFTWH